MGGEGAIGFARLLRVNCHAPAEEGLGPHRAPDHLGVGDGWLPPAEAVAGRARVGASALRPDPQHATPVHPGDAAAAAADRHDIEHRGLDRKAVDLRLGRERRLPALDQADVGAGPAHVEGDEVGEARAPGLARRPHHARGGAGEEGRDRAPAHAGGGQAAAVRLHDRKVPAEAGRRQPILEAAEIAVDDGLDVGGEGGGRAALVLPEHPCDVRGARHIDLGQAVLDEGGQRRLVRRVGVGVQEADGDGLIAAARDYGDEVVRHLAFRERREHRAVREHPFGDLEAVAAGDDRARLLVAQIEDSSPVVALEEGDVAEAPRGHEGDLGPLALEDRICRDGRAVGEVDHAIERDPRLLDGREGALVRAVGRARHLGHRNLATVERDEIGECSPDFDTNPHVRPAPT